MVSQHRDVFGTLAVLSRLSQGLSGPGSVPWGSGLQPLVDLPAAALARLA